MSTPAFVALLAAAFLLGVVFVLRPLFGAPRPFSGDPRSDELALEREQLRALARQAEGPERRAYLARIVSLEREQAQRAAGPTGHTAARASPRPLPRWLGVPVLVLLAAVGGLLWQYTVPRLPGESLTSTRPEAAELRTLERRARERGEPGDWLALARRAWELQDFQRAATAYLEVAKNDPANLEALRRLGLLFLMQGRALEAVHLLEVAVRADPEPAEPWLFLGNAYREAGRLEEAVAAWEQYLDRGGAAGERVQALIAAARAEMEAGSPGERVFARACAGCHGPEGEGGIGPRLAGNPVLKAPDAVREILARGRGRMPPVPLSGAELDTLLLYLQDL